MLYGIYGIYIIITIFSPILILSLYVHVFLTPIRPYPYNQQQAVKPPGSHRFQ